MSSAPERPDRGPTDANRPRGRRLVSLVVASAGLAGSIALLATLGTGPGEGAGEGPRRTGATILQLAAALVALVAGLAGVLDLHQRAIEAAARGRAIVAGHGQRGKPPLGLGYALKLGVLLALGTLIIMTLVEVTALTLGAGQEAESDRRGSEALQKARERRAGAQAQAKRASGSSATPGLIGPGSGRERTAAEQEVQLGNLLSDEPLLDVVVQGPSPTGLPVPSLHLRGLALTGFGPTGAMGERPTDSTTESADPYGWIPIPVAHGAPGGSSRAIELEVTFRTRSNGVVFAPAHLRAIEAPRARYQDAQDLWTLLDGKAASYGVRAELPLLGQEWLQGQSSAMAEGIRPRWIALPEAPEDSPRALALSSLHSYARSLTERHRTDLDRVLAVVVHLRSEFGYELYDTSFLSPERCVEALTRGSGSCTHFASIAVIMLRSLGIPTRIAVGYVAREPLAAADEGAAADAPRGWTIRARDGHAWIEVFFEGAGWLLFDPTPGDPTVGGALFGWSPLQDEPRPGQGEWTQGARTSAIGSWIAAGLTRLASGAVARIGLLGSWLLVACVALAAISVAILRSRRAAKSQQDTTRMGPRAHGPTADVPAPATFTALIRALDERGFRQRAGETPTGFAAGVEFREPAARGLRGAVRALLRRACTGRSLNDKEVADMASLADSLREGHGQDKPQV